MLIKCKGCGAILQDENPDKPGYVDEVRPELAFCKRCFRIKHYNEIPKIVANNEDYVKVIDSVIKKNGLIVFLVDIFDFQGTFIKPIIDKLRNKDVILVANKFDVFPKSTNPTRIVDWLSKSCEKLFFRVQAIHIVSAKKGYYIDELMNNIDMMRKGRDVYFVGCANVGKSSLINALLKRFTNSTEDLIATSVVPGTTLDIITIPFFDDNKAFIDSPGLINEQNVLNKLLPNSYQSILPTSEIKPITYQLFEHAVLFIGGIAFLTIYTGKPNITCYFSNSLLIHRSRDIRVEELLEKQLGVFLQPTVTDPKTAKFTKKIYSFDGNTKRDIVISGLGFFAISGSTRVELSVLEGVGYYERKSIISGASIQDKKPSRD